MGMITVCLGIDNEGQLKATSVKAKKLGFCMVVWFIADLRNIKF
jgi:hypothetical protein